MHNTKGKVICKCKNDKPPGEVIKIYFPPLKKGWGGGGGSKLWYLKTICTSDF